jgi:hypothetical protein
MAQSMGLNRTERVHRACLTHAQFCGAIPRKEVAAIAGSLHHDTRDQSRRLLALRGRHPILLTIYKEC